MWTCEYYNYLESKIFFVLFVFFVIISSFFKIFKVIFLFISLFSYCLVIPYCSIFPIILVIIEVELSFIFFQGGFKIFFCENFIIFSLFSINNLSISSSFRFTLFIILFNIFIVYC